MTQQKVRWITLILAVPMLIAIGWRAATLGLADHYARRDPERALALRPKHSLALAARAEQLAEAGQWSDATALARKSLQANPLQSRAYRLLARAAQAQGDVKQAYALYRIAARRLPRDVPTRTWLFNHHLQHGQAAAAMGDLDAILSAKPTLIPALTGTIHGFATQPELQPAFVEALRKSPPWRATVLSLVVQQAPDFDGTARLMQRLRSAPEGIDSAIANIWVERLINERRYEQAYVQWAAALVPEAREVIGNVFNGNFELPISNRGFDWRIDATPGVRFDLLAAGGDSGAALRLAFDDQRVPTNHLSQLLVLPPGRYQLQGRVRLEDLRSERGLVWSLTCAEDGRALLSSEAMHGNAPWRSFSAVFEISGDACQAQWLRLQLPARIPSEQRIGGIIWFDALRVSRQLPAG